MKQDLLGTNFVMEGSLAENVRNAKLLLLQLVGTMFHISFCLRMLFFLIRQEYLK